MRIENILKQGITVEDVMKKLRAREYEYAILMQFTQRGKYIIEYFPEIAQKTIDQANLYLDGMMVLPGSGPEPHFVGNPPLWNENPYNDNEYTFHLNRMHHWKTMLEAFSMTGDKRYAEKVTHELENWIDSCPCPDIKDGEGKYITRNFTGLGAWRALEVGIRGYRTWPFIIEHLINTEFITCELLEKILITVYKHCKILFEISPLLWPKADHNHYLMENLGLLSFSCMYPEFRDAEVWKEHAIYQLERCIDNQVTFEGGQVEGSPSYHNGCVFWFAMKLVFAKKYNIQVSEHYISQLKKMFKHSLYATRPCYGNSPWGDSHTYKETMTLGAVACYMAFQDVKYLQYAQNFYPFSFILEDLRDNIWRIKDLEKLLVDINSIQGSSIMPKIDTMAWQKELKQVFMRTDWSKDAISLMFACRTPIQNLHAHIDVGGFDLTAYGSPIVCDPGIFTYKDDENRKNFKTSHWHNVLTINNRDPWEYKGSWDYGEQKWGDILKADKNQRMMYAVCVHTNYEPAIATRAIGLVDSRFVILIDHVTGLKADDSVQINFHLDRTQIELSDDNSAVTKSDNANIAIYMSEGPKPSILDAKISTGNDICHDSKIVRYELKNIKDKDFISASILVPSRAGEETSKVEGLTSTKFGEEIRVNFVLSGERYEVIMRGNELFI